MNVVFYSSEELDSDLQLGSLTNRVTYQVYQVKKPSDLLALIKKVDTSILFFQSKLLATEDRVLLKKININHPQLRVVLFANKKFALEAWILDVKGFSVYPMNQLDVKTQFQKYLNLNPNAKRIKQLSVKTKEGVFNLKIDNIKYLYAQSNDTVIHTGEGKVIIVKKQLGTFEYLCDENVQFERVHRSLILNLSAVSKVDKDSISFTIDNSKIKISEKLSLKVRKKLLGKS